MNTYKKTLIINFVLAFTSLLFSLGAVELVAWFWESGLMNSPHGWELVASRRICVKASHNPDINAVLCPNRNYTWENNLVEINLHGIRDVVHSFEKPEGTYRILSLGDSVAFGWENGLEDTYTKQIETMAHGDGYVNTETINAGIMGWDLPIERAYLEETGLKYDPDVIIVEVTVHNDIYPQRYTVPSPSMAKWLRDNTYSWGFASHISRKMKENIGTLHAEASSNSIYPFPLDKHDIQWDEFIRTPIREMARLATENNAEFIVVIFPTDAQVQSIDYPTTAQSVIKDLESDGIQVLDLLPVYRTVYQQLDTQPNELNPLFADATSHPSALGHSLAAEAIYEMLMK
ncbi:MAG: hypothetical protein B6242_06210 [Anaerolineaceae bacterium 4572_78]|nr:MAG: hypothetical protein B6242_06210 [Anaerolineaceae bacterium 4572_78]